MIITVPYFVIAIIDEAVSCNSKYQEKERGKILWEELSQDTFLTEKQDWQPMHKYIAELHHQSEILLERALDDSAKKFAESETIWEFYHPDGDNPADIKRKLQTIQNSPYKEYIGHNPLIAMAVMYDKIK